MTKEEQLELLKIRIKNRRGMLLTLQEQVFCDVIRQQFPRRYQEIDFQARQATRPR